MKILLLGTGDFALPIFQEVFNNFEISGLVTQPDKPQNRGQKINQGVVKTWALEKNIKIYEPEKIATIYDELKKLDFDYIVCASYGQFVPSKILNLAKKYPLNVHGSLLPKYRGAAPIQYTILNGDKEAGISLMVMVKEMDAGAVVAQSSLSVEEADTSATLFKKLSQLAVINIKDWLINLDQKKLIPQEQNHQLKTLSPKLKKEDAFFESQNWEADKLINHIKAYNPNPGAFTYYQEKRLKVFFAVDKLDKIDSQFHKHPALIKLFCKEQKIIYLTDYQFADKKRITIK